MEERVPEEVLEIEVAEKGLCICTPRALHSESRKWQRRRGSLLGVSM